MNSRDEANAYGRRRRASGLLLGAVSLGLLNLGAGCPDDEEAALREFRDVAAEGLQTGLRSISGSIIDGLFAALLFDADDTDSGGNDNSDS